jgi:hypothetical protein
VFDIVTDVFKSQGVHGKLNTLLLGQSILDALFHGVSADAFVIDNNLICNIKEVGGAG